MFFFFFNDTATTEIYTLSLHDALPICHSTRNKTRDGLIRVRNIRALNGRFNTSITHAYSIVIGSKHITLNATDNNTVGMGDARSEERFSRNAETDLVCRLLLEKKNYQTTTPHTLTTLVRTAT